MDNFQSILIIIGIIAIIGVSIHGFLTHKKEKKILANDLNLADSIAAEKAEQMSEFNDSNIEFQDLECKDNFEQVDFSSVENQQKEEVIDFTDYSATNVVSENEFVDDEFSQNTEDEIELENKNEIIIENEDKETDLFIFNVVAKNGKELGGHELLQYFLTSGFRFGEMSIFHRHEHSDGTGPVLFSIANMMAPGVFDLDTIEQFKSEGVSFFLTAPNDEINISESFKMMLTAVEIMAEEFDCIVLNGGREVFTEKQFFEYQDRLAKYN